MVTWLKKKKNGVPESKVWLLPIVEIKNSNAVLWFLQKISVKKGVPLFDLTNYHSSTINWQTVDQIGFSLNDNLNLWKLN